VVIWKVRVLWDSILSVGVFLVVAIGLLLIAREDD